MGRVIAIGPGGRAQAPARRDLYRDHIEQVREQAMLDKKLLSEPCSTKAEADQLRRDLYLSAKYYCSCGHVTCTRRYKNFPWGDGCPHGGQRISCKAYVVLETDPADGRKKYCVEYQLFDKREATRSVAAEYGPDPNNWPYNPRSKQLKG